jgi:hypothetical protein
VLEDMLFAAADNEDIEDSNDTDELEIAFSAMSQATSSFPRQLGSFCSGRRSMFTGTGLVEEYRN